MNRQQRRNVSTDTQRIDITGIVVHFGNGQYVNLDLNKVEIIDKDTGRPLFDEVLDAPGVEPKTPHQEFANEPDDIENYTVTFDTPEGKMEYVKKGNWSGVRPAKGV